LLHIEWAAVQDPAVQATIGLAQTFVDKVNDDVVRHDSILCDVALELAGVIVVIVSSRHFLDQLLHLNVDDLVLLGDAKRVFFFLRAWGAHQDDSLWATWRIRVLQLEDAVDLLNDTHLRLAAFKLSDKALADVLNTTDLQVVLENSVGSDSLPLSRVRDPAHTRLVLLGTQVPHDSF